MNGELRRAGHGRLADGTVVTWSLAEGRRGRRWRWTVTRDGRLDAAALVEIDDRGLFARLELATATGQLTFHPDPGGDAAHGNVVGADGVRPIAVPWSAEWGIAIDGDPFGSAVGGGREPILVVDRSLSLRPTDGGTAQLPLDERGIPVLEAAREWPLEE